MVKEITLNHICKIEGHASLDVKIDKGKVLSCELKAAEGARFFEGLTLGKKVEDIQEIVTRICGICSSAHSVAAIIALEKALGMKPNRRETIVREMLLLGERIRSHATHLYFLALPDYVGFGAITMAKEYKQEVDDAIVLIRAGNKIVERFGGREMHPFVKFNSDHKDFADLKESLKKAVPVCAKTLTLFNGLKYPDFVRDPGHLCLVEENRYGLLSGHIVSEKHKIKTDDYKKHLAENLKEYATSKFVLHEGKPYITGSWIRVNTNYHHLKKDTRELMRKNNIKIPFKNPFHNCIAQAIELHDSIIYCHEILSELETLNEEDRKINLNVKHGRGVSAVEAPRGTLFHEYEIKEGIISYCNIITPTAQNLNQMEIDIRDFVQQMIENKTRKDKMVIEIEKLIRSYDPCFSCSTHFLKVNWNETQSN